MAKFCTNCGSEIKLGAKFCENCGQKLEQEQKPQEEQAELPRLPELPELLVQPVLLPVPIQAIKKALATATIMLSRELRLMLRR